MNAVIEAGISASMLGRYDTAHGYLERAVSLAPRNTKALLNLGLLCLREKKYDQAEKSLRQTLDVDPEYLDANLHLGMIAEARGDLALAKEYYIKEVNILGGTNRAWVRLFNLQDRQRRGAASISGARAISFCLICLLAAGALAVFYRLRTHLRRTHG